MFGVDLFFHGDLPLFLHRDLRCKSPVRRCLNEKTAVKDVIEACGVPHTEVDMIFASVTPSESPTPVDFSWRLERPAKVDVHPVASTDASVPTLQIRSWSRFVADGHLGKLARNLRLLGLDTAYQRDADDFRLLEIMSTEERALLTRDRRLLMHSCVRIGYCPRSADAEIQTREVLERFGLKRADFLRPYSRCLRCNQPLIDTPKAVVKEQLSGEPLTLRFYEEFRSCAGCGGVFWRGSHFEKLLARVARLMC